MSQANRSALIAKTYKVLKQHYKAVPPDSSRPLLQQMLFACCLENAAYPAAQKVYEQLCQHYFDWNEVRVTTVVELAELMRELPVPAAAAANVKQILQQVFETTYSFDLEPLRKQNIGQGIKRLEKMAGTTPFIVAYATQTALGGHFIPLDRGALEVLWIVGIAGEAELKKGSVTGLERAIPKNKGAEFGSLLHQLGADLIASPFSPTVRKILLAINADAKDRLPRRGGKKAAEGRTADGAPEQPRVSSSEARQEKSKRAAPQRPAPKPAGKKQPAQAKPRRVAAQRKAATKQLTKRKPR